MGRKIILFCAIVAIANGGVIEKTKHHSRFTRAVHHDEEQMAVLHKMSEAPPSEMNKTESTSSSTLKEDAIVSDEGEDHNKKRTTRAADYFDDEACFPSQPAFRRSIVEKLNNPSRVVRSARYDHDRSGHQSSAALEEDKGSLNMDDHDHSFTLEREAKLDEGHSLQPEDDGKDEDKIERLSNPSRSVRQTYRYPNSRYSINPYYYPTTTASPCPTTPAAPACPIIYPQISPTTCAPACPAICPTTSAPTVCPTVCPVTCPATTTTPSPRYFVLPSSSSGSSGSSQPIYVQYPQASSGSSSGISADPTQQRASSYSGKWKKPFTCPTTQTSAQPSCSGIAGIFKNSGNGNGGNYLRSNMNVMTSDPSACLVNYSGNGRGGNNITSCVNYITKGTLCCNSGNGEGGNYINSGVNIVGDGGSLVNGTCGPTVMESLYNIFVDKGCPLFSCNDGYDYDYDSSEEVDPCCSTSSSSDPCAPPPVYSCLPAPADPCAPPPVYPCPADPCAPAPADPCAPQQNLPPWIVFPSYGPSKKK
uniref:Uncharacterized protein n=1 Tax=Lygus hesperus TaxID=30085 RepID=A0A146M1L5_LYGHE